MYEFTIVLREGISVHDYRPTRSVEAHGIGRELSRDYADGLVVITYKQPGSDLSGVVAVYENGLER